MSSHFRVARFYETFENRVEEDLDGDLDLYREKTSVRNREKNSPFFHGAFPPFHVTLPKRTHVSNLELYVYYRITIAIPGEKSQLSAVSH